MEPSWKFVRFQSDLSSWRLYSFKSLYLLKHILCVHSLRSLIRDHFPCDRVLINWQINRTFHYLVIHGIKIAQFFACVLSIVYFSLFAGTIGFALDAGACASVNLACERLRRFSPGQRRAHIYLSGYIRFCPLSTLFEILGTLLLIKIFMPFFTIP